MKILLTGHTSGIGKYILENYKNVTGISRSNGYDISIKENRQRILELCDNHDVLINNAYCDFHQSNLLLDFFNRYRWKGKKIINVGSKAAYDGKLPDNDLHLMNYRMHKRSLKDLCKDLDKFDKNCLIYYATFGYVWIERIKVKYPLLDDYIEVSEAAEIIMEPLQKNEEF